MGSEELRQNVFSSVHMSTMLKGTQAAVTYPCCSFCGGTKNSKGSPKRKVVLGQLVLYTNPSESFIVWYKKQDEPKGILWLRSCCVMKGQDSGSIELISRGCRGRCSYTLKFSAPSTGDEWYRLLRQESRRVPTIGDEIPGTSDDESSSASLDFILTEIPPSVGASTTSEDDENRESADYDSILLSELPPSNGAAARTSKSKTLKHKHKVKSVPILCNPLHGLRRRKISLPSAATTYSSTVYPIMPLDSIENTPEEQVSRWSWPLKA